MIDGKWKERTETFLLERRLMKESPGLEKRGLLVLLAYLFSSVGLFFMIVSLAELVRQNNQTDLDWLTATIWIAAWLCHIVMSAAWIKNKRLGVAWPIAGTLAGVSSFLVWFWIG